jgi:hypothetical protein
MIPHEFVDPCQLIKGIEIIRVACSQSPGCPHARLVYEEEGLSVTALPIKALNLATQELYLDKGDPPKKVESESKQ